MPHLNSCVAPVVERVPSGKMMRMLPAFASNSEQTVSVLRTWTRRENGNALTTIEAIQVRGTLWKK